MAESDKLLEAQVRTGPLSLLKQAETSQKQLLIHCRNDKKILGTVKAFDRHMNLLMENVREMWRELPRKGKGKERAVNRERFISRLFLRGDSVIMVVTSPFSSRN